MCVACPLLRNLYSSDLDSFEFDSEDPLVKIFSLLLALVDLAVAIVV